MDFKKLATIINDTKSDSSDNNYIKDEIDNAEELLIDPITKIDLGFRYKLEFTYEALNKKTWINRWQKYNPTIKMTFDYNEIKSDIDDINILNLEFKKRIDERQRQLFSENELLLFGLIPFQILKYKILYIKYINKNIVDPLYIIEISLFRDQDVYINTFAYKGYIINSKKNSNIIKIPNIVDAEYIGKNATDNFLLPEFYNDGLITQEIINKNFSNMGEMEKDPSAIAYIQKAQQDAFKIKNNYACFNINYNPNDPKSEYILPLYSRQECESMYDSYGKSKNVGIFDAPCKTNEECPFYKKNGNVKTIGPSHISVTFEPVHVIVWVLHPCKFILKTFRLFLKNHSSNSSPVSGKIFDRSFDGIELSFTKQISWFGAPQSVA